MSGKSFMGSDWRDGVHAFVWIDADGKVITPVYNTADCSGDHKIGSAHFRKLTPELQQTARESVKAATDDARAEREYFMERYNPMLLKYPTAFLVTVGNHGHTIYSDESRSSTSGLSGYGLSDEEFRQLAAAGIPIVDSRSIPDAVLVSASYRSPLPPSRMFDRDSDSPVWHGPSRTTLAGYCYFRQKCGATITNCPDLTGITDEMFGERQREAMQAAEAMLTHA